MPHHPSGWCGTFFYLKWLRLATTDTLEVLAEVVGYTIIWLLLGRYALSSLRIHFFGVLSGTFYFFLSLRPGVTVVTGGGFSREAWPLFYSLDRIAFHTCDFLQMSIFGAGLICGKS